MMLALAEAMASDGYGGTTVAAVLAGAGVSRETFYQQFSSKLDCFLQTFDAAAELLLDRLDGAVDRTGTRGERAERAVTAYLEALASEPAFARLFLVESYAAGPAAIERRAAVQARMADTLADLLDLDADGDRFACRALVAAVASLVTAPLVSGDVAAVRALRAPLVALVHQVLDRP
jgi:AcrR family transcriptional regulator